MSSSTPTSSPQTTSAALHALRYDHGSKPNTGDVPPISEWEKILIGKRWIREDAEGSENVSSASSSPTFWEIYEIYYFLRCTV